MIDTPRTGERPTPTECCKFVVAQLRVAGFHPYADRVQELIDELSQAKANTPKER